MGDVPNIRSNSEIFTVNLSQGISNEYVQFQVLNYLNVRIKA